MCYFTDAWSSLDYLAWGLDLAYVSSCCPRILVRPWSCASSWYVSAHSQLLPLPLIPCSLRDIRVQPPDSATCLLASVSLFRLVLHSELFFFPSPLPNYNFLANAYLSSKFLWSIISLQPFYLTQNRYMTQLPECTFLLRRVHHDIIAVCLPFSPPLHSEDSHSWDAAGQELCLNSLCICGSAVHSVHLGDV